MQYDTAQGRSIIAKDSNTKLDLILSDLNGLLAAARNIQARKESHAHRITGGIFGGKGQSKDAAPAPAAKLDLIDQSLACLRNTLGDISDIQTALEEAL